MRKWVNSQQTREQRKTKYKIARDAGLTVIEARVIRDYTIPHFLQYVNLHGAKK